MKDKCFDLGTIQAFTDGELGTDQSERVLKHVASCDECALILTECEEESSVAYSALDQELNVLVPTERLRSRVFGSIAEIENRRRSRWFSEAAAGLTSLFSFNSPGLAVAAMAVIAVSVFAVFLTFYGSSEQHIAQVPAKPQVSGPSSKVTTTSAQDTPDTAGPQSEPKTVKAAETETTPQFRAIQAVRKHTRRKPVQGSDAVKVSAPAPAPRIVSEDSYLQTIATLEKSVSYGKDLLRPSERVAFERDLAVVNDAITKMRDEVARNPKNEGAREVLKTSYQNKVDLLNSVVEKTELMASLQ